MFCANSDVQPIIRTAHCIPSSTFWSGGLSSAVKIPPKRNWADWKERCLNTAFPYLRRCLCWPGCFRCPWTTVIHLPL